MRAALASIALVALAACGQSSAPAETSPGVIASETQESILSCADFASMTPDRLAQRFGAENITTETLPGAEGEMYQGTVVFANDPARRLIVAWNDAGTLLASASVNTVGTTWRGQGGFTIGTALGDVERLNVMPFKLFGFGWDYGGWVSDWNVGVFSQTPGCRVTVRFEPRDSASTSAMGDSEFMSNDAAVRAADPVVGEFGLMISAPQ